MSKLSREELLLRAEYLRNASQDIDEPQRRYIEAGEPITPKRAGQRVFSDKNLKRAGERLDLLMEFLLQPAAELEDAGLKFRNELLEKNLMSAHYFASLLRIYKPGIWYDRFADYLRAHVVAKWEASPVKKSRTQKRRKAAALEKKVLDFTSGKKTSISGKKNPTSGKNHPVSGKRTRTSGNF